MLILAIDTATGAVTTGLVRIDHTTDLSSLSLPRRVEAIKRDVVSSRVSFDPQRHCEVLTPQIRECLAAAEAQPEDVHAVVAGLGPGPFTGLRVGLATAAVFSDAVDCPAYGVCTLDAIAGEPPSRSGSFLVATDARRREIYWAPYAADAVRLHEPRVNKPVDVGAHLPPDITVALGYGGVMYQETLGLSAEKREPTVYSLVALAYERIMAQAPSEKLTPLYLRRPDVHGVPSAV